jgi:tRNA(Ile)-lysidine synthase
LAYNSYNWRDDESDRDEEFVKGFSGDNGIPFYSVRFKTKEYSLRTGISVQMAARELRYEWFEKIRKENGKFIKCYHYPR